MDSTEYIKKFPTTVIFNANEIKSKENPSDDYREFTTVCPYCNVPIKHTDSSVFYMHVKKCKPKTAISKEYFNNFVQLFLHILYKYDMLLYDNDSTCEYYDQTLDELEQKDKEIKKLKLENNPEELKLLRLENTKLKSINYELNNAIKKICNSATNNTR